MKNLALFLLLATPLIGNAEEKIIVGSKDVPIEMNLILKSLQSKDLNTKDFDILNTQIHVIDSFASLLKKEDFFFLVKSEIYKSLLKFGTPTKQNFIIDDAKKLKLASKLAKDPFVKWLLTALSNDADLIFSDPFYKKYLEQKNHGILTNPETKKLAKKIQLIAKIFYKINPDDPDNLKYELFPLYQLILNNIEENLFIAISESRFEKAPAPSNKADPFKLFKTEFNSPSSTPIAKKAKSVEDIIDSTPESLEEEAISKSQPVLKLPSPSIEVWDTDEASPIDIKNLPKPTNDADWLQDF